jgi:hypothetical protein
MKYSTLVIAALLGFAQAVTIKDDVETAADTAEPPQARR